MLTDATEPRQVACIGDEEQIIRAARGEGGGVFVIPTNPSVAAPLTLKLENCRVHFPDRSALDTKIRTMVTRNVALSTGDQSSDIQVVARSLKIGMFEMLLRRYITFNLYLK